VVSLLVSQTSNGGFDSPQGRDSHATDPRMGRDATNVDGVGSIPAGGTHALPSGKGLASKTGQQGSIPWWRATSDAATSGEDARLISAPVRGRFPPLRRSWRDESVCHVHLPGHGPNDGWLSV
jgi:hypothetical protein